jgi:Tripartite tricarboxylate transporter family receptor
MSSPFLISPIAAIAVSCLTSSSGHIRSANCTHLGLRAANPIATEAVINGPADGYTLLVATLANAVNATLYEKFNYNFIRDIAPVASISRDGNLVVVHPSFRAKNVPDFIAYAKARPGRISAPPTAKYRN